MTATTAGQPYLFTTHQYDKLIEIGFFHPDARIELLAGRIIEQPKQSVRHAMSRVHANSTLWEQLRDPHQVGVAIPILIDNLSEPQPDLVVYRRHQRTALHTPADILLLIEIADSTLDYDRNQKLPRYADAGIAEVWLLDLTADILERHTAPDAGRYRHVAAARAGEALGSPHSPISQYRSIHSSPSAGNNYPCARHLPASKDWCLIGGVVGLWDRRW